VSSTYAYTLTYHIQKMPTNLVNLERIYHHFVN
jgi:hypothetical protein